MQIYTKYESRIILKTKLKKDQHTNFTIIITTTVKTFELVTITNEERKRFFICVDCRYHLKVDR